MKSVVVCGSARFAEEAEKFIKELEKLGVTVYSPHFYNARGGDWSKVSDFDKPFLAMGLTHDHFYKIRMADIVYVFNKDGYSGNSTTLEIGYAVALNKPIYAYSDQDEELCRKVLIRDFISSPEELLKKLI